MVDFLGKNDTLAIVNQYARGVVDSTNPSAKTEAGPTLAAVYLEAFDDQRKSRDELPSSKLRHVKDPALLSESATQEEREAAAHPHVVEFVRALREQLSKLSLENSPQLTYRRLLEEGQKLCEKYEFRKQAAAFAEFLPKG